MEDQKKKKVGLFIAYFIGFIAIAFSAVVLYNYNMDYYTEDNSTQETETLNYVYLEPEVNFVSDLTFKQGEEVKVVDLVKNASNCVIIDKGECVDTSTVGSKKATLKVIDDAGKVRNIEVTVNVVE